MDLLQEARQGSRTFCIDFPDGVSIPFRTLTWSDYTAFFSLLQRGTVAPTTIEKAIYEECVLGQHHIDEMYNMPAGVVSTVCSVIMKLSGPSNDPEEFNSTMDMFRQRIDSLDSQIEMTICSVFPAYTPEDIHKMPWDKVLLRLTQAERILMQRGILEEPLSMPTAEEVEKLNKKKSGIFDLEEDMRDTARGMHNVENGITSDMKMDKREQLRQAAQGHDIDPQIDPRYAAQINQQRRELTPQQQQQRHQIDTFKQRRNKY